MTKKNEWTSEEYVDYLARRKQEQEKESFFSSLPPTFIFFCVCLVMLLLAAANPINDNAIFGIHLWGTLIMVALVYEIIVGLMPDLRLK